MKKIVLFSFIMALFSLQYLKAQEVVPVAHFDQAIISPHVQATFVKGDKESVTIQSSSVTRDKVYIESDGKRMRVYLEGAKELTKNEKVNENGRNIKKSIYTGTVLVVTITYVNLVDLSVRGEEDILLKSKLNQDNFALRIYGSSKVSFNDVDLKSLRATIYGESTVELKAGSITEQRYIVYGESKVDALAVNGKTSRLTLYGESDLKLNVADQINVTAYGEARVGYKGSPAIKKGITIGSVKINRID